MSPVSNGAATAAGAVPGSVQADNSSNAQPNHSSAQANAGNTQLASTAHAATANPSAQANADNTQPGTGSTPARTGNAQTEAQPPASATAQAVATQNASAQPVRDNVPGTSGVTLSHARWDHKDAGFFKRIAEYFTFKENTGYRLILRTDPQQRGGLYFQALLNKPAAELPAGSRAEVTLIDPESQARITRTFELPAEGEHSRKTQLWLGFTGADALKDEAAPVAWQVRIVAADGALLAETHSFLWSPRDTAAIR